VDNDLEITNLRERVAVVEESTKSAHFRLNNIQEQTQAIVEMGASIRYMAKQMEEVVNIVKDHDDRLSIVEKAPADNVLKAVKSAIWILFTALVTYLLTK
jgi:methionyl-tRNA synthetase